MLIPEGYGQVNFLFTGLGVPNGAEVTLGVEMPLPTPPPDEFAETMRAIWVDRISPFQVDDVAVEGVRVKYGPNETGVSGESLGHWGGEDSGEPEAPQVSVLVKKITVDGGRAGRGRLYMPGIRETRIEAGGLLNGTYKGDLQTAFDAFLQDIEDLEANAVVLHGETSPLEEPSRILSLQVQSMVATQRRRLRG